ncbi:SDR family oxidoreductase [Algiphilus sp.]|uniref:SDR family oxidoreductase n=1 Tax=Algiphilus sp. TaxID=1872431 RepID=UPI0025C4E546|nr:SDR family oxidoreductase [Algiphilus sp.]MCK5769977.1 SDR family oxidoreductase [Algiphilus sp.]
MAFDYTDRTVFVAGGTSGINLGVAQAFARAGARVSVLSRRQEKVDAAVASLRELGAEAAGFVADVRDYPAVEQALKDAHERFGAIDVLVSGAAGNFPAKATGMSANAFKSVVEIDLLGTYHVLRAAHPMMKKPGGSMINISAPQAFLPMNMQMHVCSAKAGVDMVTRVGALEWGGDGLRVNSVVPGPIADTEGMERLAPTEGARQAVMESVPLKRYGQSSEIADCCLWLGSGMAAYVTGAIIPVDGGWSLGGASTLGTGFERFAQS